MIKRRGLSLKIFIFIFLLITLVIAVSLGILYVSLPGYYYYQKNSKLKKNADILTEKLNSAVAVEETEDLIAGFARANNSSVICYDENGVFIPEYSSPFLLLSEFGREPINIRYMKNEDTSVNDDNSKDVVYKGIAISASEIQGEQVLAVETRELGSIGTEIYVSVSEASPEAKKTTVPVSDAAFLVKSKNTSSIVKYVQSSFIGYMVVSSTLQPIDEAKDVLISLIPYLLIIDFIIAWIASYFFAKGLTKPILRISDAAALMKEMKPEVLSNVRTGDELGQLSQNLDSLYLSLRENIDSLKIEMNKAAAAEQSKTEFMRAAGHELKTPIAALNGMIEGMIDNVGIYKNHDKYLNESKGLLDKLAGLVNEILMSTGRDYSDSTMEIGEVNISELIDEAMEIHSLIAESKKLTIIKDTFDLYVEINAHLLLNTFLNLISNAVKYTPPNGRVIISITQENNGYVLSFENECPYIEEAVLPKLFEPFYTLNFSRSKPESGTGLGLYIVKRNLEILKLDYNIKNTETGLKICIFLCKFFF